MLEDLYVPLTNSKDADSSDCEVTLLLEILKNEKVFTDVTLERPTNFTENLLDSVKLHPPQQVTE